MQVIIPLNLFYTEFMSNFKVNFTGKVQSSIRNDFLIVTLRFKTLDITVIYTA